MIEAPSILQFQRLAQSDPRRWKSVEFVCAPTHGNASVRAWIRRPGAMRVEAHDGTVLETYRATKPFDGAMTKSGDGPWMATPGRWPSVLAPVTDEDGLVSEFPFDEGYPFVDWDDPLYEGYRWVPMLNPIELSRTPHDLSELATVVELSEVTVVEHHGRLAWEVTARPTAAYDPRCTCCPLLTGMFDDETGVWNPGPPVTVRLDVQTGICVYIGPAAVDPTHDCDLDVTIIGVDQRMDDALFHWRPALARGAVGSRRPAGAFGGPLMTGVQ
ncbi:MAG: hypothetical protein ACSLE8_08295 [Rhodococcus sp. (in: high G+C Gram-positive bacteria)]